MPLLIYRRNVELFDLNEEINSYGQGLPLFCSPEDNFRLLVLTKSVGDDRS